MIVDIGLGERSGVDAVSDILREGFAPHVFVMDRARHPVEGQRMARNLAGHLAHRVVYCDRDRLCVLVLQRDAGLRPGLPVALSAPSH
jgi:hypothetical protein